MRIDGQSALVTGGGSGLGEAVARALAGQGARVAVLDLNAEGAQRVADEIAGLACIGDVASEQDVSAALEGVAGAHGPARLVVSCAGIGTAGRTLGRDGPMPLTDFERVLRVNLVGTFNVLRLAAERMAALDPEEDGARGAIVNTASVAAFDGQIGQAAYAASKGGIVSMALPIAREFARFGIRVNTIAPGIFLTPLLQGLPEEAQQSLAAGIPFPSRLGDPAEFADAVLFCLRNDYLNGEVIRLDGATRLTPK
ncbi:SDR family NAD(P)-dependent oxidoreductase [Tranquillimonas alkanivorans]|uniref:NAD(P)-dependent dehydrogenase, short-chain alcohol dehydrogenase family n=1 Tax=Tranquillimonas alkanivorans TaxID=441119 RepID=A0A1I5Q1R2_9RHOB|nr:SDR family NAD(P)-dependent oxidoreductase [Tranquillimonas alkanivorans]SFP39990.1 NAD(P)-dependent dehydrogenase, short-chain alcohol dehydrogenase family [Tranquillimonas alkanivorans]